MKPSGRLCAIPSADKAAAGTDARVRVKALKVQIKERNAQTAEAARDEQALRAKAANAADVNQRVSSVSAAGKNSRSIIRLEDLHKVYTLGLENEVRALDGVSLDIKE